MTDKVRLLSTRPLDDSLVEKASLNGISIDVRPFIHVVKLMDKQVKAQIGTFSTQKITAVFTSVNSVEAVVDALPKKSVMPCWNLYCIGGNTFSLVKKFWAYERVRFTAKNAMALAKQIKDDKITEVVYFCGDLRREELPALLQHAGIKLTEVIVYNTISTPQKVEDSFDGILFFSPSAVDSFFLQNNISKKTILFAIGETTATAIRSHTGNPIVVSNFPAKDQLVDKAIKHFITS